MTFWPWKSPSNSCTGQLEERLGRASERPCDKMSIIKVRSIFVGLPRNKFSRASDLAREGFSATISTLHTISQPVFQRLREIILAPKHVQTCFPEDREQALGGRKLGLCVYRMRVDRGSGLKLIDKELGKDGRHGQENGRSS